MYQRTNIRPGMVVMSHDGVQLGRVIDVASDSITIEKGNFFFLRDFPVPLSDIATVRGDEILLLRDHAELRHAHEAESHAGTANGTVGVAGYAAPPPGEGLGLGPTDLTEARMDGAKFQDHGRYYLAPTGGSTPVDEEVEKEAPRTSGPETKPPTRY
jgi:hypothetical protein